VYPSGKKAPAITKRMHPSRRGGHPYGLKDAAKWHEGCTHPAIADTHRASWPWASRHLDVPFGPEARGHAACWTPASRHTEVPFRELRTPPWPSWSRGNDEKDASLGGKACGHRAASTPASEGKAHRFADSREACALIDVPMSWRAPAIDEQGYDRAVRRDPRVRLHRRRSWTHLQSSNVRRRIFDVPAFASDCRKMIFVPSLLHWLSATTIPSVVSCWTFVASAFISVSSLE